MERNNNISNRRKKRNDRRKYIFLIFAITIIILIIVQGNKNFKDGEKVANQEYEIKKIEGVELLNSSILQENGILKITADVENMTEQEQGGYLINVNLLDSNGQVIETVQGYLNKVNANSTGKFELNSTIQIKNIHDYTISR